MNEPAFPLAYDKYSSCIVAKSGMDLRDYFAGKALCGLLADINTMGSPDDFARYCYDYADAMMEARKK